MQERDMSTSSDWDAAALLSDFAEQAQIMRGPVSSPLFTSTTHSVQQTLQQQQQQHSKWVATSSARETPVPTPPEYVEKSSLHSSKWYPSFPVQTSQQHVPSLGSLPFLRQTAMTTTTSSMTPSQDWHSSSSPFLANTNVMRRISLSGTTRPTPYSTSTATSTPSSIPNPVPMVHSYYSKPFTVQTNPSSNPSTNNSLSPLTQGLGEIRLQFGNEKPIKGSDSTFPVNHNATNIISRPKSTPAKDIDPLHSHHDEDHYYALVPLNQFHVPTELMRFQRAVRRVVSPFGMTENEHYRLEIDGSFDQTKTPTGWFHCLTCHCAQRLTYRRFNGTHVRPPSPSILLAHLKSNKHLRSMQLWIMKTGINSVKSSSTPLAEKWKSLSRLEFPLQQELQQALPESPGVTLAAEMLAHVGETGDNNPVTMEKEHFHRRTASAPTIASMTDVKEIVSEDEDGAIRDSSEEEIVMASNHQSH